MAKILTPSNVLGASNIRNVSNVPPNYWKRACAELSARDLAKHFASGAIDPKRWENLDDDAVIEELVAVRGIGHWTAEMFLIFNLLRPDVFPVHDIGLLNALGLAYNRGARVSREQARELSLAWQPWRTVATWYLWRSLEPVLLESS